MVSDVESNEFLAFPENSDRDDEIELMTACARSDFLQESELVQRMAKVSLLIDLAHREAEILEKETYKRMRLRSGSYKRMIDITSALAQTKAIAANAAYELNEFMLPRDQAKAAMGRWLERVGSEQPAPA